MHAQSTQLFGKYTSDLFAYHRRRSREVRVGNIGIGANNPIRIQSMLTSDTRNTEACIKEALGLADAGCEIIRLTAQTKVYAQNLQHIVKGLRQQGCEVPLVADIHFKPDAAMEAAKWVEKIRINPGNYVDKKKFEIREYSDAQYNEELDYLREHFSPLVKFCREHGRAMRIGTNHGSLSDRIMNRYGDTPHGMVESALEFAHIARDLDYHNFVFSMKASNPKVMIEAYRLLVARLHDMGSDWNYPIHLGVTEAGDGEDGRIKSAIGIGSLLGDGIGDTIRVSLTEDAIHEIPVAYDLAAPFHARLGESPSEIKLPTGDLLTPSWDVFSFSRRASAEQKVTGIALGGEQPIRVCVSSKHFEQLSRSNAKADLRPEIPYQKANVVELDANDSVAIQTINALQHPTLVSLRDGTASDVVFAYRRLAAQLDPRHAIILKNTLHKSAELQDVSSLLESARVIGSLLCDGIGDAVYVRGCGDGQQLLQLSYNILQAAGSRIFKTDYVACPSCGRTLFNLQDTTRKVRAATGHLKGVRIAIMGCIVNGPGEMADADFGYVGGAPGKINLYVGKTAVKFNIPEQEAVERLIDLIKEHHKWIEPQA